MQVDDFELLYPQGLLCNIDNVPEGLGSVYLITDLTNDKTYVGQTWTAGHRWVSHKSHVKTGTKGYLYRAMRSHGTENFTFNWLGFASTQEELNNLEKLWIILLGSTNRSFGYNRSFGGSLGRRTEEAVQQMAQTRKEEWQDPVIRSKRISAMTARWKDPEYQQKRSDMGVQRFKDPEERRKMSESVKRSYEQRRSSGIMEAA